MYLNVFRSAERLSSAVFESSPAVEQLTQIIGWTEDNTIPCVGGFSVYICLIFRVCVICKEASLNLSIARLCPIFLECYIVALLTTVT